MTACGHVRCAEFRVRSKTRSGFSPTVKVDTHEDAQRNPSICLTFTDVKDNVYVTLTGQISQVTEKNTITDLWDEQAEAYFQEGPDDPRVALLRFEPDTGELQTAPSHPIVLAIKFLEAKLFGERPTVGTKAAPLCHSAGRYREPPPSPRVHITSQDWS